MNQDIERMLEEREAAKERWETFELDDSRFPFPRKNYKYVSRIVEKEGGTPESIQRALQYFDRHDIWVLRAEAYQHLAKQLDTANQIAIAHKVYDFVYDELPGLSLSPELYGGNSSFGEDRLDQAMARLNWAAHTSDNTELAHRHHEFMTDVFPRIVRDMPDDGRDSEQFITYWQEDFEARLNPGEYCVKNRIATESLAEIEKNAGYVACMACRTGFMSFDGTWETLTPKPCLVAENE